jgi:hypothetical protein
MSATGPSRRSMLFAPLAIAFAGAGASTAAGRGLSHHLGFIKPLRPYVSKFGARDWKPVDQPFELFPPGIDPYADFGRSLPDGLRLPKISDEGNGLIADSDLGEFIGFGLPDESCVGHGDNSCDKGVDSVVGLVGVVDQNVTDQRSQEQFESSELDQKRVERFLRFICHLCSSIGLVALPMLDRARRLFKSAGRE